MGVQEVGRAIYRCLRPPPAPGPIGWAWLVGAKPCGRRGLLVHPAVCKVAATLAVTVVLSKCSLASTVSRHTLLLSLTSLTRAGRFNLLRTLLKRLNLEVSHVLPSCAGLRDYGK